MTDFEEQKRLAAEKKRKDALRAAAPDLAEACEAILAWYFCEEGDLANCGSPESKRHLFEKMRAALRKAKGEA